MPRAAADLELDGAEALPQKFAGFLRRALGRRQVGNRAGIAIDRRSHGAAQQIYQRIAIDLPAQIPERHIDAAEAHRGKAQRFVHRRPRDLMMARIAAQQHGRQHFVDMRRRAPRARPSHRFADADQAFIG